MTRREDQLVLGAFLHPTGHHQSSWRHPSSPRGASLDLAHYIAMAQTAERGCFDLLFLADGTAVDPGSELARRANHYVAIFEPLTLLAALATQTHHIGLVATASTTYNQPLSVARAFASLDHLSGGRAGWNLVTSANPQEALNFSRDEHLAHRDRYARARAFAEVVTGLWDCWDDDALVEDRASGIYLDEAKVRQLNHVSEDFQVRGPLNMARSPQGRPVIVQAGSSEAGRDLAAATADLMFTAQPSFDAAKLFYADVKERLAGYRRAAGDLRILPGISTIVAASRAEAEDRRDALQALTHPALAIGQLSSMLGFDLAGHDPDGPLPPLPPTDASQHFRMLIERLAQDGLSILAIARQTGAARSHGVVAGTASDVADHIEQWFTGRACDGFNIMPPLLPSGLDEFVDHVIPELQRRGLFRDAYEATTLRGNLGLSRPGGPSASRDRDSA